MWVAMNKSSGSPACLGDFFTQEHRLAEVDCLSIKFIFVLCIELGYIFQSDFQFSYMASFFFFLVELCEALGLVYTNTNFRIPSPFFTNWGWYVGCVTGSVVHMPVFFFSPWVNHRKGITSLCLVTKIEMSWIHFHYIEFLGNLVRDTNITLLRL